MSRIRLATEPIVTNNGRHAGATFSSDAVGLPQYGNPASTQSWLLDLGGVLKVNSPRQSDALTRSIAHGRRHRRKHEEERASFAQLRLDPDRPAVVLNHPLAIR